MLFELITYIEVIVCDILFVVIHLPLRNVLFSLAYEILVSFTLHNTLLRHPVRSEITISIPFAFILCYFIIVIKPSLNVYTSTVFALCNLIINNGIGVPSSALNIVWRHHLISLVKIISSVAMMRADAMVSVFGGKELHLILNM